MKAWDVLQNGKTNPMENLLMSNSDIGEYLKPVEIKKLLDAKNHIGNARDKSLTIVKLIDKLKA